MAEVSIATLKSYFANGKVPPYSNYEDLIDTLAAQAPSFSGASYRRTAEQTMPTGWDNVDWNSYQFDTDSYYNGSYPDRFTVPETAYYRITAYVLWLGNSTTSGQLVTELICSGGVIARNSWEKGADIYQGQIVTNLVKANASDYAYVHCYNGTGSSCNIAYNCRFTIQKVGS